MRVWRVHAETFSTRQKQKARGRGENPTTGQPKGAAFPLVGSPAPTPRSTACHARGPHRFTADPQNLRRRSGATTWQGRLVQRI